MQAYYCKCHRTQSYGSMGPAPCMKCDECGTHPTINAIGQPCKPEPHKWEPMAVETDEGEKILTVCTWCGIKKTKFLESI